MRHISVHMELKDMPEENVFYSLICALVFKSSTETTNVRQPWNVNSDLYCSEVWDQPDHRFLLNCQLFFVMGQEQLSIVSFRLQYIQTREQCFLNKCDMGNISYGTVCKCEWMWHLVLLVLHNELDSWVCQDTTTTSIQYGYHIKTIKDALDSLIEGNWASSCTFGWESVNPSNQLDH